VSALCLHILQDSTYANWIVEHFEEAAPGKNEYVVFTTSSGLVNANPDSRIQLRHPLSWQPDLSRYNKILVQYLDNEASFFLWRNLGKDEYSRVIWVLWGGDFYFIPGDERRIYEPYSWNYLYGSRLLLKSVYHFFRSHLLRFQGKPSIWHRLQVLRRIPSCASGIMRDVEYIQNRFGVQYRKVFEYRFLPLELMFSKDHLDARSTGDKIIVGNSADPANNHVEAYQRIAQAGVTNAVVSPLSYGGVAYREGVMGEGRRLFGDRYEPLVEKLDKDAYYRKLGEVGFAYYNQHMQMGVGNLIGLLWLGVKVFLNSDNPLYREFLDWGLVVYPTSSFSKETLVRLSPEAAEQNRSILQQKYRRHRVIELHRQLLESNGAG
jgi:dTDP-N-acetylfucosamine:lipid II N-acetylfucosaminyltransferase